MKGLNRNTCIVIGLGDIGMGYDYFENNPDIIQSHCKSIELHNDFDLIAGIDPDKNNQEKFILKYNKPAFDKLEDIIGLMKADVYVLACPTNTHFSILNKIIEFDRPKVILCEKPLSYNLKEANLMIQLCDELGIELFVNYIRRSDIGSLEIKKKILQGEFRSRVKGVCYYSKGFIHNGSHFLNLCKFWLGDIINFQILQVANQINKFDLDVDIYISFVEGDIFFMSTWDKELPLHVIELLGQGGKILYSNGGSEIEWRSSENFENIEFIKTNMNIYQFEVYNNISIFLKKNSQEYELCTGLDAYETLNDCIKMTNILSYEK